MSLILLLNTGQPEVQVALIKDGEVISQRKWAGDRTVSTKALTAITELLIENQLTLTDITRVAVFSGPGHYSALRTGIVMGTMLVEATGAQLVSVTGETIEQLAHQAINGSVVEALDPVYQ
jgi:tRNA A37 threonylcarbamoyladenosine modification protein TsaB